MSDPRIEKAEVEPAADTETDVIVEPVRGRRRRTRSMATDNSVNMVELRELIQLIRENEFSEFELEREGFRVRFRRGGEIYETASSRVGAAEQFSDSAAQGAISSS